nr:hypothetical protein [Tanacetum cinerariifolium]
HLAPGRNPGLAAATARRGPRAGSSRPAARKPDPHSRALRICRGATGSNPSFSANERVNQKVIEGSNPILSAKDEAGSIPNTTTNQQTGVGAMPTVATEPTLTWQQADTAAAQFLGSFFATEGQPFNEFSAMRQALAILPDGTALHLANSMAVRYANILGLPEGRQIDVFANRGTSGIDGCNSTAVGAALAQPERPVVLLTGDV